MPSKYPARRQLPGASAGRLSVALADCSDVALRSETAIDGSDSNDGDGNDGPDGTDATDAGTGEGRR